MIGVPGTGAAAVRRAARGRHLRHPDLAGQLEHSICFAIPQAEAERTARTVRHAFRRRAERRADPERRRRAAAAASCRSSATAWRGRPASRPQVFGALARGRRQRPRDRAGIIGAQHLGGHRRAPDARGAAVGALAVLSRRRTRSRLGLIGPGAVGSVLLEQLASQARAAARATSTSICALRARDDVAARWRCRIRRFRSTRGARRSGRQAAPTCCGSRITSTPSTCRTRSSSIAAPATTMAEQYPRWLGAGIHVVTPNKRANSGPLDLYDDAARGAARGGSHYLYEATVGAGLPIIADAARPARDRRRDPPYRRHPVRHARISVQRVGRHAAVLGSRARREGERLYRARSARRPLGHRRRAQAGDPRPRDGPARSSSRTSSSKG